MKQYSNNLAATIADQMTFFTAGRPKGQRGQHMTVTITRDATSQGGGTSSWTATCIRATSATDPSGMVPEGARNTNVTNAYNFVFPRGTDIQEVTDTITDFEGIYDVLNTAPDVEGDQVIGIIAYTTRR